MDQARSLVLDALQKANALKEKLKVDEGGDAVPRGRGGGRKRGARELADNDVWGEEEEEEEDEEEGNSAARSERADASRECERLEERVRFLEGELEESEQASAMLSEALEEMGEQLSMLEGTLEAAGGHSSEEMEELMIQLQLLSAEVLAKADASAHNNNRNRNVTDAHSAMVSSTAEDGGGAHASSARDAEEENAILRRLLKEAGAQLNALTLEATTTPTTWATAMSQLAQAPALHSPNDWLYRADAMPDMRASRSPQQWDVPASTPRAEGASMFPRASASASGVVAEEKAGLGAAQVSRGAGGRQVQVPMCQFGCIVPGEADGDRESAPQALDNADTLEGSKEAPGREVVGPSDAGKLRELRGAVQRAMEAMKGWEEGEREVFRLMAAQSHAEAHLAVVEV